MKRIVSLIILLMLISVTAYASELAGILDEQLEISGINELNDILSDIQKGEYSEVFPDFDLKEISKNVLKGEWSWDITVLLKRAFAFYCHEFYAGLHIMLCLVGVIILCSFSENIQRSFGENGVGNVLFIICFSVAAAMTLKSFYVVVECAVGTVENVTVFMKSLFPITLTLLATSGAPVSAGVFHPVLMMATDWTAIIVGEWLVPLIMVSAAFSFADAVSPALSMGRLASMFKKIVKWSLGILLTVFTGIVSVQSLVSPVVDKISVKTLKYATGNFIPIAGGLLSDTVDLLFSCSSVIKNVVGTAGCVAVLVIISIPCIKMLAYMTLFYITAAVTEPISDSRMTKLMDSVSGLCTMLFVITLVISVMFIINITVIMGVAVWST